jgi:hypothetical protein
MGINMTKVCSKCKQTKSTTEFNKNHRCKDGWNNLCKICVNTRNKEWNKNNPEKTKENNKKFRQNNPEYSKKWYNNNVEYYQERKETYSEQYKEYYKSYMKYLRQDPLKRLKHNIKSNIITRLKKANFKKSKTSLEIVGLENWNMLKEHIEKQWEDGMSWDNHGLGPNNTTWHIDHIIPLSSATTEEEVYKLNHYTNLRPMWGSDNIRKGNKF